MASGALSPKSMLPTSADGSPQESWRVRCHHEMTWRTWAGEVVVYDDLSGDTMKLDIIMSEIFRLTLHKPADLGEIVRHLASTLDLKADQQLRHLATLALQRLRQAALIETACAVVPAETG